MTTSASVSLIPAALPRQIGPMTAAALFAREFVRSPRMLGTCFPCSAALGHRMIDGVPLTNHSSVIELGPGIGSVTRAIVAAIPRGCHFLAIEKNPTLARISRALLPSVPIHRGDAADVANIARAHGIFSADLIVSGLPLLLLSDSARHAIMTSAVSLLRPGGVFAQVTYSATFLPASKRVRALMCRHFAQVLPAERVWANIPPAFVYRCIK